jgi:magnesium chelatase family protein
MSIQIHSCAIAGVDAVSVNVKVDVVPGAPSYQVMGIGSRSVKEGSERLRAALRSLGDEMPLATITVRLTPANLEKQGRAFDLPILLGMLDADSRLSLDALDGLLVLGELGLDGKLRAVKGALPAARLARAQGWRGVLVPRANAHEALAVDGIEVYCADHLSEVLDALKQAQPLPLPLGEPQARVGWWSEADISDVPGQAMARAALEIAAAGGHHVLMVGSPGSAQARLACRIPTILPAMTHDEFMETMNVFSAIGLAEGRLAGTPPFRTPHHTISPVALIGGGTVPQPGEVSLAHNGVLFLGELQEFSRGAISSLLKPLQERTVTVSRKKGSVVMPASFLLVAAASPCPCGWLDSGVRECTCSDGSIRRYWARMSRPLLDRFDLRVSVKTIERTDHRPTTAPERSEVVRARITSARARQRKRLEPWGIRSNAEMSMEAIAAICTLDGKGEAALAEISESGPALTARSRASLLRVARTIADLREQDAIDAACLLAASTYRAMEAASRPAPPARTLGSRAVIERVGRAEGSRATAPHDLPPVWVAATRCHTENQSTESDGIRRTQTSESTCKSLRL